MQKCDFAFEVLIHDDASTDDTQEIIKEYQAKYPEIIKAVLQKENQYSKGIRGISPRFNFPRAQGKYIAMCEGDDYWTDPLKLQKQVDILERFPEVDICAHPSFRLYGEDLRQDGYGYWGNEAHIISAAKVVQNHASNAGLQSIMFRKKSLDALSDIIKVQMGGHSTIQIFYSLPNGLYYLPDYMSVYRVASSSSISKMLFKNDAAYLERQRKNWKGLELLNQHFQFQYDTLFRRALRKRVLHVISSGYLNMTQILGLVKEFELGGELKNLLRSVGVGFMRKLRNRYKKK